MDWLRTLHLYAAHRYVDKIAPFIPASPGLNRINIATLSNSAPFGATVTHRVPPAEVAESDIQPVTNYTPVVALCVRLTHH
jgi:hypothetical protein